MSSICTSLLPTNGANMFFLLIFAFLQETNKQTLSLLLRYSVCFDDLSFFFLIFFSRALSFSLSLFLFIYIYMYTKQQEKKKKCARDDELRWFGCLICGVCCIGSWSDLALWRNFYRRRRRKEKIIIIKKREERKKSDRVQVFFSFSSSDKMNLFVFLPTHVYL